jgi:hypothetical protein
MIRRPGNPYTNEDPPTLYTVSFLVDDEHMAMLNELEAEAGPNVYGRRSRVLRALLRAGLTKLRASKI